MNTVRSLYDTKNDGMESFNLEGDIDLNDLCNLEYFTILNLCPTDNCDTRTGFQKRSDGPNVHMKNGLWKDV